MSGLVCGLDVHKGWCEATVIDWFGNVVVSRRVSRDELLPFLSRMNVSLVAMESSGYVHPMYRALRGGGMHVLVAHPKKARLIAENRLKNDRGDSMLTSYIQPDDVAVVRRRAFLVRVRTGIKNRMVAALAYEGIFQGIQ